ncbi:MAG TPA: ABC transporter permease [Puia sp.]|nr:ABC transporter permease [Puia sp.]
MFKNYFKTAWRNLLKNKTSSSINISGLAVGMAVAMLIGLWIWDELSFNKYHQNYDRIVQVMQKEKFLGATRVWDHMPWLLVNELKTSYKDDFKHIVTAISTEGYSLSSGEKKLSTPGLFIEAAAPEMLTLRMLKGSWSGLGSPHSILLSASVAKALFGDADPVGKPVNLNNNWDAHDKSDVKVTGVFEDLPQNTRFNGVKFFLPWELYAANNSFIRSTGWEDHRFEIYAELQPNADLSRVDARIRDFELNIIKQLNNSRDEVAANPRLFLHPMSKWHLYADFKDGLAEQGAVQFVWLVGIIGAFVLLLACINFMNLSTARSEKRAKEVGIRKAIGSLRGQLIRQFFSESFLVVALAFILALSLVAISLPWFNDLAAKQMYIPLTNPWFWLMSAGFILLTGLLAGSYPALYLSSFNPVQVLKGTFRAGQLAAVPRKALVVLQFSISISLMICTIIVYNQIIFAKNRPVGYTRDGLLMIPVTSQNFTGKFDILRSELKKTGAITEIAESESAVTAVSSHNGGFTWNGKDAGVEEDFGTLTVSYEYGKTIGWNFLEGRDFSREYNTDSSGFVINETAAKFMGLKQPVGETVRWKSKWLGFDKEFKIIGVIKDMLMQSPYEPVKPTIFRLGGNANWIYARINPDLSVANALSKIESVFKTLIPATPFEYKFADDEFAKKFATEVRIGQLASLFAILAVFISCLGLFGMASFVAEQRVKEIGVRKVLGASVFNLWRLLSKDFVLLVVLSLVIAGPTAYYFMHRWLQNYQYRTGISWWIFAAAGIGSIFITVLTVSYQSIKAALLNPVISLRAE